MSTRNSDTPKSPDGLKSERVTRPAFLEAPQKVFVLKRLGGDERVFKFHKDRIVIGSVVSADMKLNGEGISPIHAVIEMVRPRPGEVTPAGVPPEGGAVIYDLASESGVFVNGAKTITRVLNEGDEIVIGTQKLKFSLDDARKSSPRDRVRESEGRKLFINPNEDLAPLLLEDEREVHEIFDLRPTSKRAMEVVMSWRNTILNVEHFVDQKQVTIGNAPGNDFGVPPLLSAGKFPIVTQQGGEFTLNLDSKMGGVLQRAGRVETLDQVRASAGRTAYGFSVPISQNDFAKVRVGEIDFYFSFTSAPPKLKVQRIFDRDPLLFQILTSSVILTVLTIAGLRRVQIPQAIEAEQLPERIATILYQPEKYTQKKQPVIQKQKEVEKPVEQKMPEPKETTKLEIKPTNEPHPEKPVPRVMDTAPTPHGKILKTPQQSHAKKTGAGPSQKEAREGQGARASGKEGTRGSKHASATGAPQKEAKRPSPNGGVGKGGGGASQVAQDGNIDLMKGFGGKIQNMLGNTAEKLGKGGKQLEGFGGFTTIGKDGLALSGDGKGGGGTAEGLGGLSDRGTGGGRVGTGMGASGTGNGIIGGKARVVIRTGGPEEAVVMGSIDADAVEQALLAHRDEFRLCYEREINAENPKLAGRVGTTFVIGSSGRVTQAGVESTSLKNANVERCVLTVIKRIDFPIPRGGGVVQVSYPFKFNSSGH